MSGEGGGGGGGEISKVSVKKREERAEREREMENFFVLFSSLPPSSRTQSISERDEKEGETFCLSIFQGEFLSQKGNFLSLPPSLSLFVSFLPGFF